MPCGRKPNPVCSRCLLPFSEDLPKVRNCGWCNPCRLKIGRENYIQNREKKLTQNAAWREANLEKHKELVKRRYFDNRTDRLKQIKDYRKTHEGTTMMRATNANSRAKKWGCEGILTAEEIREAFKVAEGNCAVCKTALRGWEIDHIVPLSKGGLNTIENIQIACPKCNRSKGTKSIT